jgi:hypothetical protein
MKKLILAFVIAYSTVTFAQTGKKTEANSSKSGKTATECYSTKKSIPLTCVRVEDKEGEQNDTSLKKAPVVKPERKTISKEDKKTGSSGQK